jgi:hypothetical protein
MATTRTDLQRLIEQTKERVANMTSAEFEAMVVVQRTSWVRGEMAIGLDAKEASWRRDKWPRC